MSAADSSHSAAPTPIHTLIDEVAARQERPTVRSRLAAASSHVPPWAARAFCRMALKSADPMLAHETVALPEALGFSSDIASDTAPLDVLREAVVHADRRSVPAAGSDRSLASLLGRDGRWWRTAAERRADTAWWSTAVRLWTDQGFLPNPVVVVDTDLHKPFRPSAHPVAESASASEMLAAPGAPSVARFAVDRRGSLALPGFQPMPEKVAPAREVGWIRLSVLAHELAHTVFAQVADPFRPSWSVGPNTNVLQDFFRAPYADDMPNSAQTLNEAFADVYGAMMVLESSGHDPEVVAHWESVAAVRLADQAQMEIHAGLNGDLRRDGRVRRPRWDSHATGPALTALLAHREQWRGATPEDLRDLALRLASDHIVLLCHPDRTTQVSWRAAKLETPPASFGAPSASDSREAPEFTHLLDTARQSPWGHHWAVQDNPDGSVLNQALCTGHAWTAMVLQEAENNASRSVVRSCLRVFSGRPGISATGIPESPMRFLVQRIAHAWHAKNPLFSLDDWGHRASSPDFSSVERRLSMLQRMARFASKELTQMRGTPRPSPEDGICAASALDEIRAALLDRAQLITTTLVGLAAQQPAPILSVDLSVPIQPDRPLPRALASLVRQDAHTASTASSLHMSRPSLSRLLDDMGRPSARSGRPRSAPVSGRVADPIRPSAQVSLSSTLGEDALAQWASARCQRAGESAQALPGQAFAPSRTSVASVSIPRAADRPDAVTSPIDPAPGFPQASHHRAFRG